MTSDLFCKADMNYIHQGEESIPVEVPVMNGRLNPPGKWQDCGFELMSHHSDVVNWDDEEEVERVYYDEMIDLTRRLTGCDFALVSGHICRNPEQAQTHEDLAPITFVHSDFADSYGERMRSFYHEGAEQAVEALRHAGTTAEVFDRARRMLIIQFWRNTGPEKMDLPLAFCDARSVGREELRPLPVTDYAGGGFDFETLGIGVPDDPATHRWYVFPEMNRDEVVAFRTYDSGMVEQGKAYWTPHSAFHDPEVPIGRPSRRSIELRATCLFM